ncbi:hypothetical protein ABI_39220 [Asticcacaulis biprosthecium C19]|uniref:Uncharacterized protein n=1 Tax=Asticcacaulis biprosthecium C19 TaxID=715226 RepID=F4QRY8_9CAUL|nr:DUF4112 domain-containing protein [Asticcacaulis biprosthecium]EGF89508.1 hypothetical protein ABI_39220 [Asticcacaulis biprosthecium C19]
MLARSHDHIRRIYDSIESVKRLSDRVIGIGPINIIGLDGILALLPIPILSTAYSILAGGFLLIQGIRSHATLSTIATSFIILAIDAGLTTVEELLQLIPGAGWLLAIIPGGADALFQGHLYAAHLIQKDIDRTHYVEGRRGNADEHREHLADMRAQKGKKRVVYLG